MNTRHFNDDIQSIQSHWILFIPQNIQFNEFSRVQWACLLSLKDLDKLVVRRSLFLITKTRNDVITGLPDVIIRSLPPGAVATVTIPPI